ncbi:prolipoprotein diacylglyceryl transferase [Agrococcus sp. SGAir0287]|uniref:prolipoprotein diacylglyceryl transferase n=1 Tax=Agrococcus sp. SGAir0287 TaxID=2070347 RepID=UPI0026985D3A
MLQSIPSPTPEWQGVPVGEWLHALLPFLPDVVETFSIRTYALCILAGILLAAWITARRLRQRGVDGGLVIDVAVFAVILGIVGARLFHVLTYPDEYLGDNFDLYNVIAVWNGGVAIFGALIAGALGIWIGCRYTGLRFTTFVDALAPGMLVAQAAGRVGNYVNNELFGQPTGLPWGLEISPSNPAFPVGLPDGTLFHPTFLYEIVWNLIGAAVIILWLDRKRDVQWGKAAGFYLVWYGVGRIVWETLRINPSEVFFGIRVNVWAAIGAVALGVIIWVVQSRRHPGLEPSPWQPGREPEDDAVDSDVYSELDEADTTAEPAVAAGTATTTT